MKDCNKKGTKDDHSGSGQKSIENVKKTTNSSGAVNNSISFGVRLLRAFKFLWWPSCLSFVVCFRSVRQQQPIPKEIFDSLASAVSSKSPDCAMYSQTKKIGHYVLTNNGLKHQCELY